MTMGESLKSLLLSQLGYAAKIRQAVADAEFVLSQRQRRVGARDGGGEIAHREPAPRPGALLVAREVFQRPQRDGVGRVGLERCDVRAPGEARAAQVEH